MQAFSFCGGQAHGAAERSANRKTCFVLYRVDRGHLHPGDSRRRWPGTTELFHGAHGVTASLDLDLHRPVGTVGDPSRRPCLLSRLPGGVTKEDALDVAPYTDVSSLGHQDGRLRACREANGAHYHEVGLRRAT